MKTQEELYERLVKLSATSTADPIGFKRNALIEFATRETMLRVWTRLVKGKLRKQRPNLKDWESTPLTQEAVEMTIRRELDRVKKRMCETNSEEKYVRFLRTFHHIEIALWLLDDEEALEFINTPDAYEKSAVKLITWIDERYSNVSDE